MRVFLDANVVLDVMAHREPFFSDSVQVLSLAESGVVEGLIAAHTVTTLFYLLNRKVGAERARSSLLDLLRIVEVVSVDQDRILQAFSMKCRVAPGRTAPPRDARRIGRAAPDPETTATRRAPRPPGPPSAP